MSDTNEDPPEEEEEEEEHQAEQEEEPEPAEKDWEDTIEVQGKDRVLKIKIAEGDFEKWAMYGLFDDSYWMVKTLGEETAPNANKTVTLINTGALWEIYHPSHETEQQNNTKQDDPEEEDEEDSKDEAREDIDPASTETVELDILTLIVTQSPDCGGVLFGYDTVQINTTCKWFSETINGPSMLSFGKILLDTVEFARKKNPEKTFRSDFSPFFDSASSAGDITTPEHPSGFFDHILATWQTAGIQPSKMIDPTSLLHQDVLVLLYRFLSRVPEKILDEITCATTTTADDDEPTTPVILQCISRTIKEMVALNQKKFPKELFLSCPGCREIHGIYKKRGREEGKPKYYKGDPVRGEPDFVLSFHVNYGWRLRRNGSVIFVAGGVVDLLPTDPARWLKMVEGSNLERSVPLYIMPSGLQKSTPLTKYLENPTHDPIVSTNYNNGSILYFSDFLLLIMMIEYRRGLALGFERLLDWKLRRNRPLTDPIGFHHLLFMNSHLSTQECVLRLVESSPQVFKALGKVPLRPFIMTCLPRFSSEAVLKLGSILHLIVADAEESQLDTYGTQLAPTDEVVVQNFVKNCRSFKTHYEEAYELLSKRNVVPKLVELVEKHGLLYTDVFLFHAVEAGNIDVVEYLITEAKLPAVIRKSFYMAPVPLLPYVVEKKQTDMLLMLIRNGHSLNVVWDYGSQSGIQYVRAHYSQRDKQQIFTLWKELEADRMKDPETGFGMLRPASRVY
eukprot:TRINITY_DN9742_c1_g1_i1.p1 TRINITY_DN9742_c1_g1~~TRINITY_DN9742_c1_g1_i1.p1  ORF type:complete len:746 (+),score=121.14 TRINITY_DN9742_c1_g1_i1:38-2239(+)